ncbi:hypothetical protein ACIPWL_28420 [Streptomyces sp. NPDC090023]|uniref:hypothetical protein n=1 Tax=unclassified Streptomyces TaxID=2593676 RepID=UPI00380FCBC7
MNKPLTVTFVVTTASAVTAIVIAAQDNYGVCAVALVTLAADALGAGLHQRRSMFPTTSSEGGAGAWSGARRW